MKFADRVLDLGLNVLDTEATTFYLCTTEPVTFTEATSTYALGNKVFGAGACFGAPAARSPNGRKVTSAAVTDGATTVQGTANFLAVVDATNSRLHATFPISAPQTVYVGNPWTLAAFDAGQPNQ